jgi:hypothetical protein
MYFFSKVKQRQPAPYGQLAVLVNSDKTLSLVPFLTPGSPPMASTHFTEGPGNIAVLHPDADSLSLNDMLP